MSDPLLIRGHVEEGRRAKRTALEAMGVTPFAYAFARSHTFETPKDSLAIA